MIALIQRVTEASVVVDNECIANIEKGLMILVGVEKKDTQIIAERLLEKCLNYRVFADDEGKMNLSLKDISGGLLLVPQFTLAANTSKGRRPSFASAAPPEQGQLLFDYFLQKAMDKYPGVESGRFGADMKVSLVNDGPVTFWLN